MVWWMSGQFKLFSWPQTIRPLLTNIFFSSSSRFMLHFLPHFETWLPFTTLPSNLKLIIALTTLSTVPGIDLQEGREGGTWFAMNPSRGKIAALLNIIQPIDKVCLGKQHRGNNNGCINSDSSKHFITFTFRVSCSSISGLWFGWSILLDQYHS